MISQEDINFIQFWSINAKSQKTSKKPLLVGLSIGLLIGLGMMVSLELDWYTRANMVANSKLSAYLFVFAILILSVFMAFLYRNFRWEMQEQRYQELISSRDYKENKHSMQPSNE